MIPLRAYPIMVALVTVQCARYDRADVELTTTAIQEHVRYFREIEKRGACIFDVKNAISHLPDGEIGGDAWGRTLLTEPAPSCRGIRIRSVGRNTIPNDADDQIADFCSQCPPIAEATEASQGESRSEAERRVDQPFETEVKTGHRRPRSSGTE